LENRVEWVENRVPGTEDKEEELYQTVKYHESMLRKKWMEQARHLKQHEKTKPTNHGYRRRRRDTK
jgi:hypothetical protein